MRQVGLVVSVLALVLGASFGPASASHSSFAVYEEVGEKNGAPYAMFVPAAWNGRLVLYAHGFVDPEAPIALPDVAPTDVAPWVVELRETLLASGHAVVYSAYSENGWAVKDGSERTHELRNEFILRFGKPRRSYIIGRSLGALITLMLAEKFPDSYHGALALCGPVAGGWGQTTYIGHARVLFDFFFPGVIPGDTVTVPPLDYSSDSPLVQSIVGAIVTNPQAAVALASVDQIELPWTSFPELVNSIVRVLGYHVRGTNDLLARTGGHSPFDNSNTSYTGLGAFDPVLNAGVGRFVGEREGFDYLMNFYQPRGLLRFPLLTLHTTLDPDVPFAHEKFLATIVANAGTSKWLAQQHYQRYGHCNFSPAEAASAFSRLVTWTETKKKPASGVLASP
jgi:pimeloyl-ACP methyl ester carboxylesterase